MSKIRVTFTLGESDAKYFRAIYREAKKATRNLDPDVILERARGVVGRARANKKTPEFAIAAVEVLADLIELIQDEEYAAPRRVKSAILAGLGYFTSSQDLIPDQIPGLGFLDDAIMVKFIESEFRNELWGYRRFRKLRDLAGRWPWSSFDRRKRLQAERRRVRAKIAEREAKRAQSRSGVYFGR
ncbi:MAG: YkvA family protein [Myxococcota bacterium]